MRYGWILSGLCLVLFFAGSFLLPITDPVESNYVLTAREMIRSGDLVSPRIYGHYWYDKPIMFYWELIVAFKLFGVNEFAARFFPALLATAGVFLTYVWGGMLYDRRRGFVAAVIMATSLEYWYLAHAVITDMTLFVAISVALVFFYRGYVENNPRLYYVSYAAAGVAVLTKGPIGLCLPGLIILLFLVGEGNLRHLLKMRPFSGAALFLTIIALWYYPMYRLHGEGFIDIFFGVHNYLRATVSEHPAQDVIYYYLLIFLAGFIPWVFPALYRWAKNIKKFGLPKLGTRERFLFVWAFTVPAVFQCFATKYLTYTLPYMLPVAILLAGFYTQREVLFRRMATVTFVALNILLVSVAAPLCEENSEKTAAGIIAAETDDALVMSFGRRYPASLVFYLDRTVYRLEKEADFVRMSPRGLSWSNTNVMPFITPEELPSGKKMVVLVGKKSRDEFLRLLPYRWKEIGETENSVIYAR